VPYPYLEYVLPQLAKHGIQVSQDNLEWHEYTWNYGVELGLTNSALPLRIPDVKDVAYRLLYSFRAPGEAVLMQWVISPTLPRELPINGQATSVKMGLGQFLFGNQATHDEISARRQKLSEANFHATLRIAAAASTKKRAQHLAYMPRHALNSTRGPGMRFFKRMTFGEFRQRIDKAAGSVKYGMQLSTSELAALMSWPIGTHTYPVCRDRPGGASRRRRPCHPTA